MGWREREISKCQLMTVADNVGCDARARTHVFSEAGWFIVNFVVTSMRSFDQNEVRVRCRERRLQWCKQAQQ